MQSNVTTATTKGIVIGLILAVLLLGSFFLNLYSNKALGLSGYVIFLGSIIWSVWYYGKQINHHSTFGGYFGHGFKVAAICTSIVLVVLILLLLLFPDFKEANLEVYRTALHEQNKFTEDQITQSMELIKKFIGVYIIGGTMLSYLFFGAIAALIGAGITKKNPDKFPGDIS